MLLTSFSTKFPLGQIVVTTNALNSLPSEAIESALRRHAQCDWGGLGIEDAALNDDALIQGGRLFSAYGSSDNRVWVITEWDRSVTTVLLPEDY